LGLEISKNKAVRYDLSIESSYLGPNNFLIMDADKTNLNDLNKTNTKYLFFNKKF
jgi:hypothetical protein